MAKASKEEVLVTAVSRVDRPVRVPYNESYIIVASRGRAPGLVKSKLGKIPQGIRIV